MMMNMLTTTLLLRTCGSVALVVMLTLLEAALFFAESLAENIPEHRRQKRGIR